MVHALCPRRTHFPWQISGSQQPYGARQPAAPAPLICFAARPSLCNAQLQYCIAIFGLVEEQANP